MLKASLQKSPESYLGRTGSIESDFGRTGAMQTRTLRPRPTRTLELHRGDRKCLRPHRCDTNSTLSPDEPLQGAPSCESSPRVHAKIVLTAQVRAKLIREGQRAPKAHSSGAQGRWKVTSTTRVRYKLDPDPPWETISPFLRLVPKCVPDHAFAY